MLTGVPFNGDCSSLKLSSAADEVVKLKVMQGNNPHPGAWVVAALSPAYKLAEIQGRNSGSTETRCKQSPAATEPWFKWEKKTKKKPEQMRIALSERLPVIW